MNAGDTVFVLLSAALVMLMTPGSGSLFMAACRSGARMFWEH